MLVLNRRIGEQIVVPQLGLVFTVLEVQGEKVSVGVAAPKEIMVHRSEVWERIQRNAATAPNAATERDPFALAALAPVGAP